MDETLPRSARSFITAATLGDPILYWNGIALEANRTDFTNPTQEQGGPTLSSRALAIVHLAMYDAFAGVEADPVNLPPYQPSTLVPPSGATVEAAVAGAAHFALSELYPSQSATFDDALPGAPGAPDVTSSGFAFGRDVALAMLAARLADPAAGGAYSASPDRGRHRVDPDNPGQGYHAPYYGAHSGGFAITVRHELDAPPAPGAATGALRAEYLAALRQVRAKGIKPELVGTLPDGLDPRTPTETMIGLFWGYDGAPNLGTPPRLYNQIVRQVALAKNNTPRDNARLFAFVNAAMGDAGILAWDQKYKHDLWRPVLGLREHDLSTGAADATPAPNDVLDADADPFWLPLGAPKTNGNRFDPPRHKNFTPNFPAYPSGHATFGAAALHITRLFYQVPPGNRSDDNLIGSFVSDEFDGINRDLDGSVRPKHVRAFPGGLWQMIVENGLSRVLLGVHWVFDAFAVHEKCGSPDLSRNIGGVNLGLKIAEDIFAAGNGLAPTKSTVLPRS